MTTNEYLDWLLTRLLMRDPTLVDAMHTRITVLMAAAKGDYDDELHRPNHPR